MPCTACGTSSQNKKTFQLNRTRKIVNGRVVYLTAKQIEALRLRRISCRRTLVFT